MGFNYRLATSVWVKALNSIPRITDEQQQENRGTYPAKIALMHVRMKAHSPGEVVKVRSLPQYPLPVGLGECVEVVIREIKQGIRVVADPDGKLYELSAVCVVCDYEYQHDDKWLPPSHPLIAKRLATGK